MEEVEMPKSSFSFDHHKFVFGEAAVKFMFEAKILIYGISALGAEIAKNLILSGVKHLTIQDGKMVSNIDVETNFFLENGKGALQENRSKASYAKLKLLNPDADIKIIVQDIQDFDLNYLSSYQYVIVCDECFSTQIAINNFCSSQKPPIKFISANIFGILSSIFCDFGVEVRDQAESIIEKQLWRPTLLSEQAGKQNQRILHLALVCIYKFSEEFFRLPNSWCHKDSKLFIDLAERLKQQFSLSTFDHTLFESLSYTSRGCFLPLVTLLGGMVTQEAMKAVLGTYRLPCQWFHFAASEVASESHRKLADESKPYCFVNTIHPSIDKQYQKCDVCLDDDLLMKLQNVHLFMVGCGNVGCEILKMLSLIGAATNGQITVSDEGVIEKTHVMRHFLFSNSDINQLKSVIAAKKICERNQAINVRASPPKLCAANEHIYNDSFFKKQDIVIANLDSTSSRRYLDNCCICNGKPWIDTGTMATNGHVQIIIPHLTEHYFSLSDPEEEQYPYCSIKSFPSQIEHTIQWAVEKFNNLFVVKPFSFKSMLDKYGGIDGVLQKLEAGEKVEDLLVGYKLLKMELKSWPDCVLLARNKFEKYFSHKAEQLLHLFPPDLLTEGVPFWKFPKLTPRGVEFDQSNSLHMVFVISSAKLFANVWNIPYTPEDVQEDSILRILKNFKVTKFQPSCNKIVVTSENEERPTKDISSDEGDLQVVIDVISKVRKEYSMDYPQINPEKFKKCDDDRGQMDFIYSSSNIRASMYGIDLASYVKIQFIAGKIIPSLPSTNAVIAGLAMLELLKILKGFTNKSFYSNYFVNLAVPTFILSEPASPQLCALRDDFSYSIWDHLNVAGSSSQTLMQFIEILKDQHKLDPTMITQGSKIIWAALLPGYNRRKSKRMSTLLHLTPMQRFAELSVTTLLPNDEEEMAPSVHYHIT